MRHHDHIYLLPQPADVNIVSVLTLLVAMGALATAIYGLSTWKKQLKGTHHYELAKRMLVAAYELRYEVKSTRSPFVPADAASAYQQRWNSLLKPARVLKSSLFEAEIVWDKEKAKKLGSDMDKLLGELSVAIEMYLMSKQDQYRDTASELFTVEQAYVLYSNRQQPEDQYAKKVDKIISKIEEFATQYLKKT